MNSRERITVVVADDHPIVRTGIALLLEQDPLIEVVAQAEGGQEAIDAAAVHTPTVVLMDLRMPDIDGVHATQKIVQRNPAIKVLILTTYETDADILRAVEAGATGYLLKAAPQEEILNGVRMAARGETVLAPQVAAKLMAGLRTGSVGTLTERELSVLALVRDGLGNRQIAKQLHISEATVKTHLLNIYAKLEVNDRTRAVVVGLERGLL